jgi:hypothetical protein
MPDVEWRSSAEPIYGSRIGPCPANSLARRKALKFRRTKWRRITYGNPIVYEDVQTDDGANRYGYSADGKKKSGTILTDMSNSYRPVKHAPGLGERHRFIITS